MTVFRHYILSTLIFLGFCLQSPVSQAEEQNPQVYQQKLDNIRDKIVKILARLNDNQNKRSNVRSELQKLERKIAKTAHSLRITRSKHKKSSTRLASLKKDLKKLKKNLFAQRKILSQQIRSAYAMGQQPQLKLLLNQQQPTEMGRTLVYYNYLNRARSQQISSYLENIKNKQRLEQTIEQSTRKLAKLLNTKRQQKKSLSQHRASRKRILATLNQNIQQQELTLDNLHSSRNRIEQLLMSLGELLADIPDIPVDDKPFGDLKGHLPWPIKGTFSARYGTSKNQGDLTWKGVVIKADYGTPVRAISYGRVAFADWLQGFGFITIIDHNNGYLSLYGHNQELYKQAGDWVEAGEVIATVGDSGGQRESGLYFELRQNGSPINPAAWCSLKAQHLARK